VSNNRATSRVAILFLVFVVVSLALSHSWTIAATANLTEWQKCGLMDPSSARGRGFWWAKRPLIERVIGVTSTATYALNVERGSRVQGMRPDEMLVPANLAEFGSDLA
jgi:hypothetical protein